MTPTEHYEEAEKILGVDWTQYNSELAEHMMREAQVHAILATASPGLSAFVK